MAVHDAAVPDTSTQIRVQVGYGPGSDAAPYMLLRSPGESFCNNYWMRHSPVLHVKACCMHCDRCDCAVAVPVALRRLAMS